MICNKLDTCPDKIIARDRTWCTNQDICVEFCDNRSNASCTERKKTYTIDNPNRSYKIISYHVDGGIVITDSKTPPNTGKCDYMFVLFDNAQPTAILIELKGKDTNHAIEQISNTLVLFSKFFSKCSRVYGRIVNTQGIPNMQNTPQFITLNKCLKKLNGNLNTAERYYHDKYSSLG